MKLYLKKKEGNFEEVVIDQKELIMFNYVHDNLENPTKYIAEHSYSVKLPVCPHNNRFFDHIEQVDSVVIDGGYSPAEPMRYMAILDNGECASTGTALLMSVESGRYYTLSLTGSLSRIFGKLLNAGYDTTKAAEDSDYYLMADWLKMSKTGQMFIDEQPNDINNLLVYASWKIDNPIFDFNEIRGTWDLKAAYGFTTRDNVTETQAFIASLIGFAPTAQGKYKDFDSEKWIESGTVVYIGSPTAAAPGILPVLCSERNDKGQPIQTVEPDGGLIEPQIGEYRSYYQQPYIYITALWQLFKNEFANITDGYTLTLDNRWFNENNTDIRRLVYMLPQLKLSDKVLIKNIPLPVTTGGISQIHIMPQGYVRNAQHPPVSTINTLSAKNTMTTAATLCTEGKTMCAHTVLKIDVEQFAYSQSADDNNSTYYFSGFNPFEVIVEIIDSNNNAKAQKKLLVYPVSTDGVVTLDTMQDDTYINDVIISYVYAATHGYEIVTPQYRPWKRGESADHSFTIEANINAKIETAGEYRVRVSVGYLRNVPPFVIKGGETDYYFYNWHTRMGVADIWEQTRYGLTVTGSVAKTMRSNSIISLERLFGDIKPFDVLLQFSKTRHLLWLVNDTTKTVTVKRAADHYKDCGAPVDRSEVVNRKDMTITPLSWAARRVVLDMSDMECDYVDGYEDRHGRGYGCKEIVTANTTTKETIELLGGVVKSSAMLSQTIVPIRSMMTPGYNAQPIEVDPMPLNVSSEEQADCYGNFYYRHDNGTWAATILNGWHNTNYVIITDDHPAEAVNGIYCWRGAGQAEVAALRCWERPVFNTVSDGGLSVLFAAVREQYTSQPDEPTEYLYGHCWENYIKEVYDVQNKTITAWLRITPSMIDDVRRNPLMQIGNIIYLLTEIKGWNDRNSMCKCKMRQISNLERLTI